jgi:triphosphoribosyl-dephospho-CoA synthase
MDQATVGHLARQACHWEATAPKPGNVHPQAAFADTCYEDFILSAEAIIPAMDAASSLGVGQTVFQAVTATRSVVASNTNLGLILLLAPLAAVPRQEALIPGVEQVLDRLTAEDSRLVYAAIRLAQPGGLGSADHQDVQDDAPDDLLDAMREARGRDLIAEQYCQGFSNLFNQVSPWIHEALQDGWSLSDSIVHAHVRCMATHPDSLIARKCGTKLAQESQDRAQAVLASGAPSTPQYQQAVQELDQWLRADGHRRNPGTTADMIGAALFIGLRHGTIDSYLSIP